MHPKFGSRVKGTVDALDPDYDLCLIRLTSPASWIKSPVRLAKPRDAPVDVSFIIDDIEQSATFTWATKTHNWANSIDGYSGFPLFDESSRTFVGLHRRGDGLVIATVDIEECRRKSRIFASIRFSELLGISSNDLRDLGVLDLRVFQDNAFFLHPLMTCHFYGPPQVLIDAIMFGAQKTKWDKVRALLQAPENWFLSTGSKGNAMRSERNRPVFNAEQLNELCKHFRRCYDCLSLQQQGSAHFVGLVVEVALVTICYLDIRVKDDRTSDLLADLYLDKLLELAEKVATESGFEVCEDWTIADIRTILGVSSLVKRDPSDRTYRLASNMLAFCPDGQKCQPLLFFPSNVLSTRLETFVPKQLQQMTKDLALERRFHKSTGHDMVKWFKSQLKQDPAIIEQLFAHVLEDHAVDTIVVSHRQASDLISDAAARKIFLDAQVKLDKDSADRPRFRAHCMPMMVGERSVIWLTPISETAAAFNEVIEFDLENFTSPHQRFVFLGTGVWRDDCYNVGDVALITELHSSTKRLLNWSKMKSSSPQSILDDFRRASTQLAPAYQSATCVAVSKLCTPQPVICAAASAAFKSYVAATTLTDKLGEWEQNVLFPWFDVRCIKALWRTRAFFLCGIEGTEPSVVMTAGNRELFGALRQIAVSRVVALAITLLYHDEFHLEPPPKRDALASVPVAVAPVAPLDLKWPNKRDLEKPTTKQGKKRRVTQKKPVTQ
eukprot:TRINITY_DN876_c0_g1_i1.p1 TRINITY_DN876_c0_g1~~TRINITY_DN876_c0_g1_i1.p1  ORF type:complete len:722 (+),score=90.20 TRINITY_DN876_c0_g1_i1:3497-5662(+)